MKLERKFHLRNNKEINDLLYEKTRDYAIKNDESSLIRTLLKGIFSKDDDLRRKGLTGWVAAEKRVDTEGYKYKFKALSEVLGLHLSYINTDTYIDVEKDGEREKLKKMNSLVLFLSDDINSLEKITQVNEIFDLTFHNKKSGFNKMKGDVVKYDMDRINEIKGQFFGYPNESIESFIENRKQMTTTGAMLEGYYENLSDMYITRKIDNDKSEKQLKSEIDRKHQKVREFDEELYNYLEEISK